jgi:hypothetical protein
VLAGVGVGVLLADHQILGLSRPTNLTVKRSNGEINV